MKRGRAMNECTMNKTAARRQPRPRELDRQLLRLAARALPIDRDVLREFICPGPRLLDDTHVAQR
jgi:hypothetical protein